MKPSAAAIRFALGGFGGLLGWLLVIIGHVTGPVALLVPTLAFFAGGSAAASGLGFGPLESSGFGVTLACGGLGSFLAVLGTQSMTGRESPLAVTGILVGWFVLSFGGGATVCLALILKGKWRVYTAALKGFTAGAVLGGLIVTAAHLVTRGTGAVAAFWTAAGIALLLPGILGGVSVAGAAGQPIRRNPALTAR